MLYLYLDESGDLGFDFQAKQPSRFFTICILAIHGVENDKQLRKGVRETLRRKRREGVRDKLKGSRDKLGVKLYLYELIRPVAFEITALTVDKWTSVAALAAGADRFYEEMARLAIERVELGRATNRVSLVVDRSRGKSGIRRFNVHVAARMKSLTSRGVAVDIRHRSSHEDAALQAADTFSWGVFRKYEHRDAEWYKVFSDRIACDELYVP